MNTPESFGRNDVILKKAFGRCALEAKKCLDSMRSRSDYSPCYDYFLELAAGCALLDDKGISEKTGRPIVSLLCVQSPIELVHAAGFHPYRVFCGAQSALPLASSALPVLMCPMLKSALGSLCLKENDQKTLWVLPATCDWVVKFGEMAKSLGVTLARFHCMELPRLKEGERSQKRWLDEVYEMKAFLEKHGGVVDRKALLNSIAVYQRAWSALVRLMEMRSNGSLSTAWFMLISNMFFYDAVERWTKAAESVMGIPLAEAASSPRIFLAGSPIFFPNFKIPALLEEAGLFVVADDLCSSERIFPGAVAINDTSMFGLMNALAQRYHQGCQCPTFMDNDRRINSILGRRSSGNFSGIVFHVLKGCHPYGLESCTIEGLLKKEGLKFMRIETDYTSEDGQSLLTRLEAYSRTLEG